MDSGVVLFLMRHRDTSQILPLVSAVIAVELMLNFLGEDSKQANRCCFGETGNFLGICAATGGTGDGRVTVVGSDIAFALFLEFLIVLFFFAFTLVEF